MKTILCCQFALMFLAVQPLLAQANFLLNNRYGVDAPIFDAGGVPLAGPNYLAELWGGATSNSLTPCLVGDRRLMVEFRSGGYFRSTEILLCPVGVPPGGWAWLQVRAWESSLGATYEDVEALGIGGYGESLLFYARGGNPADLLGLPAPLIGLQSFSLRPVVPEPSTWALLAFGGLGLGLVARRKRRGVP